MASRFLYKSRKRRRTYRGNKTIKIVDHHCSSLKLKKLGVDQDNLGLPDCEDYDVDLPSSDEDNVRGDVTSHDDDCSTSTSAVISSEESDYHVRQKKAAEGWSLIRSSIVSMIIQMEAIPIAKHICVHCNKEEAVACCRDCGSLALYCIECIKELHSCVNITHSLLVWKEEELRFVPLPHTPVIQPPHICNASDTYFKEFTCADVTGIKNVKIKLCSCCNEIESLIMLRFFPATPKNPRLIFTFNLMNILECLFLECQMSVQDFTTALQLYYQNSKIEIDVLLYPVIIDSFEQFRNINHELRTLKAIIPLRENNGTRCPACSYTGKPTISIDANFGLCRKVSAGTSVANPLHLETGVFCDQSSVDYYVSNYNKDTRQDCNDNECNNFLATHVLRSKSRFRALDETGVIGAVCKHEFPLIFSSLRHGERLSYVVYVMEEIQRKFGMKSVNLLYDVACTLERHLKKQGRADLLSVFKLAVPVFHSYGHKIDCQLKYSPRNISGYGMADGECCERLWSYLRRFARITKESRPSRRLDILTDAVLYYGRLSCDRFGKLKYREKINQSINILFIANETRHQWCVGSPRWQMSYHSYDCSKS